MTFNDLILFKHVDSGVCQPKIPVGQFCTASGQCVENAECQTPSGGLCICNAGYFPTGSQGGGCAAYKLPGNQCLVEDRSGFVTLSRLKISTFLV